MESALDAIALLMLVPVVAYTTPLAIQGNGKRPWAVLVLVMVALWGWASIEGMWTDQNASQHVRRLAAAVTLFAIPWWASHR